MNFKAVIFDLDGTLLDSVWVWDRVDEIFLGRRGFSVPDDYKSDIASLTFYETADYTVRRFGLSDTREALMQEWIDLAIREYSEEVGLRPGAHSYLSRLHALGIPLAVGTTLDERMLTPCLARNGILPLFDCIMTAEKAGTGKHSPLFFDAVAQKLGLPCPDILVYDDVPKAVAAAARAGMQVCGITGGSGSEAELRQVTGFLLPDFTSAPIPE